MKNSNKNAHIVIVGAGPAGLSTAWFLKKAGYTNVLVLEKLGRVGGMAYTITAGAHSFDLGANYVTPGYPETLKLAETVGAKLYSEEPFVAMTLPDNDDPAASVQYTNIFQAIRQVRDEQSGQWRTTPIIPLLWALLRFIFLRFRLRSVIDGPTLGEIHHHPELCVPFGAWLKANRLSCLATLFELPITLMGFGQIDETAAPYVLKFMTLRTFIPMVLKETPIIGPYSPWPKRFVRGFQRLWELVAWQLNVRLNVNVQEIRRHADKITIKFQYPEQILSGTRVATGELVADYLILACPLQVNVVGRFLDLSPEERSLFQSIIVNAYCMTTFAVKNLQIGGTVVGAGPLAAVLPHIPPIGAYKPWGVAKQWPDSDFVQFYTRVDSQNPDVTMEEQVIAQAHIVAQQMGGEVVDNKRAWHTYNCWPYFQHVTPANMAAGFYARLEKLQGVNNTFYVGGVTNFELIEVILQYAKHLVATRF